LVPATLRSDSDPAESYPATLDEPESDPVDDDNVPEDVGFGFELPRGKRPYVRREGPKGRPRRKPLQKSALMESRMHKGNIAKKFVDIDNNVHACCRNKCLFKLHGDPQSGDADETARTNRFMNQVQVKWKYIYDRNQNEARDILRNELKLSYKLGEGGRRDCPEEADDDDDEMSTGYSYTSAPGTADRQEYLWRPNANHGAGGHDPSAQCVKVRTVLLDSYAHWLLAMPDIISTRHHWQVNASPCLSYYGHCSNHDRCAARHG
jgi:hypothetical protein